MTVRVTLSVFGRIGAKAIRDRTEVLPERYTVNDLLAKLTEAGEMPVKYGQGAGYSEFLVVVDGVNAMVGDGLTKPLKDGSRVVILPAMAGG